jgi:hypothetical protein
MAIRLKPPVAMWGSYRELVQWCLQALTRDTAPEQLPTYTVSTLPVAATYPRGLIYVSNESGGAIPAFSDGLVWRRCTDRAVVS